MLTTPYLLALSAALWSVKVVVVDGCGFPMPAAAPPPPMCGCGCGRKKRKAVEPHVKNMNTPCPQTQWKLVMEESMMQKDTSDLVNTIQSALYRRYAESKFLVICSANNTKQDSDLSGQIQLSSGGDGYCNLVKHGIWCQAVSLSA